MGCPILNTETNEHISHLSYAYSASEFSCDKMYILVKGNIVDTFLSKSLDVKSVSLLFDSGHASFK